MQINVGTKWQGTGRTQFVVISVTEVDEHIWVHYRDDKGTREYSCYKESFVQRYSPVLNEHQNTNK